MRYYDKCANILEDRGSDVHSGPYDWHTWADEHSQWFLFYD